LVERVRGWIDRHHLAQDFVVAGVFGIDVVGAHLLRMLAREAAAAGVPSNPKSPYEQAASSG
jgi:hypothetical protein